MTFPTPSEAAAESVRGRFGLYEFEQAAAAILRYLAADSGPDLPDSLCGGSGPDAVSNRGWGKPFRVDTFPEIDPTLFAMLCCAGWVTHKWFPKGAFTVSKSFIERVGG